MDKINFFLASIWFNLPVFRITYEDGGMSKPMFLYNAISIWLDGVNKIWIDYNLM